MMAMPVLPPATAPVPFKADVQEISFKFMHHPLLSSPSYLTSPEQLCPSSGHQDLQGMDRSVCVWGKGWGPTSATVRLRGLQGQAPEVTRSEGGNLEGFLVSSWFVYCPLCCESHGESSSMWVAHLHPNTALVADRLSVHVCGLINTWGCVISSRGRG